MKTFLLLVWSVTFTTNISQQGDSGGPLTYKSGGQHILIGATSWGRGCAQDGMYGVYASISYFRKWIEKKMKKMGSPQYCISGPDAYKRKL